MSESQYTPYNFKREYSDARDRIERFRDFLAYLFEHSEHCDHISQSDAWEEFIEWEEKQ